MFKNRQVEEKQIEQFYTPKEFVSGFVPLKTRANPVETAWHAASTGLDTENIRLVSKEADGGVYFIAAAASSFASIPNCVTPLYSAIPGTPGHQGDGAYFQDIGGGMVAVVIKKGKSLESYSGEKSEAIRFAGGLPQITPVSSSKWNGYHQLEMRYSIREMWTFMAGMAFFAILFLVAGIYATMQAGLLSHNSEETLLEIRATQQTALKDLNRHTGVGQSQYLEYKRINAVILKLGGQLKRYQYKDGDLKWIATFPLWVSDLSELGRVKTQLEGDKIIAKAGEF